MFAQLGGVIGPWLVAFAKGATGRFSIALTAVAGFLFLAAIMVAAMRVTSKPSAAKSTARPGHNGS